MTDEQRTWREAMQRETERIRAEQAAGMYPDHPAPPPPEPRATTLSRAAVVAAPLIPQAGQYVILERDGQQRRGLTDEPQVDGTFWVFWVDAAGERLPGFWWSAFDKEGEPLLHGWRIVGIEPGGGE